MKKSKDFTEEEIKQLEEEINSMSQEEMAERWRFSPPGDPMFRADLPLFEKFNKRFQERGK